MNFDQVLTFLSVARLGAVRRAAAAMNLSQPAVSNRILALEKELNVTLFDRSGGGMQLSRAGVLLVPHAEVLEQTMNRISLELAPSELFESVLRLGVIETAAESWLAEFLTRFHRLYPRVLVEVSVDISVNLREQVLERSLDLVVLMGPISDYTVTNVALPSVEMGWFKRSDAKDPDLSKTPVITFHRKSRPFQEIHANLTRLYGSGVRVFPTSALSTGFEMVGAGIGAGAFPKLASYRSIESGRVALFNPGWTPSSLAMSASYLREYEGTFIEKAVQCLNDVACGSASQQAM
ncbi:MAG: LysR family transcriptional regulator [Litoreibacter sp.]|uniref:LysR substrate-binding domain-containing protein n=1 Tax=Litoreibacter sp. TaxID=1969459 RepID=UPI0032990CEB